MLLTASWEGVEASVELDADCRTFAAFKYALQEALPGLEADCCSFESGGRSIDADDAVCGLEDGGTVRVTALPGAQAAAALRAEGCTVDAAGFCNAARANDVRQCGLYLDAGVGLQVHGEGSADAPLHVAATHGQVEACMFLLDRGAAIEGKGEDGDAPLHCVLRREDDWTYDYEERIDAVCRLLLDRGADSDARNCRGETPLHYATYVEEDWGADVCKLLLDRGCSVDAKTKKKKITPLFNTVLNGQIDVCRLLLERGAAVDTAAANSGFTPLHWASMASYDDEHLAVFTLLLNHGAPVDARDASGRTPLHHSARREDSAGCRLLLEGGASVHVVDSRGHTPLHLCGCCGVAEELLARGAAVDAADSEGHTPLHHAAGKHGGGVRTCKVLVAAGASTSAKAVDGRTPLDVAAARSETEVYDLLVTSARGSKRRCVTPPSSFHPGPQKQAHAGQ